MLDLKQKGAMAKTGKSEPKVAEHWFSRIIRKEMFLNIPIILVLPSYFLHITVTVSEKRTVQY